MKLSVVVPIYKAEETLNRCIDSIVCQSFKDWELILIDDGSPDSSGAICDEYAGADKRIKVIHKHNEGVSIARNCGLEMATGDYVTFIDSDDYIEGDCFSLMQDAESDLVVFDSISYKPDGTRKYWYNIDEKRIESADQISGFIRDYINLFVLDGPCAKFFRRSLIDDLKFPEGQPLGEDNVFMLSYITRCKTIDLKPGLFYVIDDHYENGYAKYRMPAKKSVKCVENIIRVYKGLKISEPSFEERMFQTFFLVLDPRSNYDCWYKSDIVRDLEDHHLSSQNRSFRQLYRSGKSILTKRIGYYLFWNYPKVKRALKRSYSKIIRNKKYNDPF